MMTSERMMEIYSGLQDVIARRNSASVYTSLGYTSNLDLIPAFTVRCGNSLFPRTSKCRCRTVRSAAQAMKVVAKHKLDLFQTTGKAVLYRQAD